MFATVKLVSLVDLTSYFLSILRVLTMYSSLSNHITDLQRRPVEVNEKLHLLESNIAVSEMQCDLGELT